MYVYDHRGLRIPLKKGGHIRVASTPAIMEGGTADQQKDCGAKFTTTRKYYFVITVLEFNRGHAFVNL